MHFPLPPIGLVTERCLSIILPKKNFSTSSESWLRIQKSLVKKEGNKYSEAIVLKHGQIKFGKCLRDSNNTSFKYNHMLAWSATAVSCMLCAGHKCVLMTFSFTTHNIVL